MTYATAAGVFDAEDAGWRQRSASAGPRSDSAGTRSSAPAPRGADRYAIGEVTEAIVPPAARSAVRAPCGIDRTRAAPANPPEVIMTRLLLAWPLRLGDRGGRGGVTLGRPAVAAGVRCARAVRVRGCLCRGRRGVLSAPSPFGTFATDGVRYLEEAAVATNEFVFSGFAGPLTAFGLNITDYGDFGTASLVMTINGTTSFVIATPSGPGANGSLRYFGVVATAGDTITEVRLRSGDAVGIDKVGISAPAVVPEPMPALLVALGIAAIAGSRRDTAARSRR